MVLSIGCDHREQLGRYVWWLQSDMGSLLVEVFGVIHWGFQDPEIWVYLQGSQVNCV